MQKRVDIPYMHEKEKKLFLLVRDSFRKLLKKKTKKGSIANKVKCGSGKRYHKEFNPFYWLRLLVFSFFYI